jgi:hypothetical protein
MNRKELAQTCVLAVLCGALGAVGATRLTSGATVAAQTAPPAIAAQRFNVVDQNGTTRASLSSTDGFTQLVMNDSRGVMRVLLQVNPDGSPFAMFWDKSGGGSYDTRFQMPSVNFLDPQNKIMASLPWTAGRTVTKGIAPVDLLTEPVRPSSTGRGPFSGSASLEDVQWLQGQIDQLRAHVNKLAITINAVNQ